MLNILRVMTGALRQDNEWPPDVKRESDWPDLYLNEDEGFGQLSRIGNDRRNLLFV